MNDFDLLHWLLKEMDRVPCEPRLYSARLWALQLLLNQPIDSRISTIVVEPLARLTDDYSHPESRQPLRYRFSKFTALTLTSVSFDGADTPNTWSWQCVRDLAVFGLREAIAYFNTYHFVQDATGFLKSSIDLYHEIAKLYLTNVRALKRAKDQTVKNLLQFVEYYGEGFPQNIQEIT